MTTATDAGTQVPDADVLVAWLVDQRWYGAKGLAAEPAGTLVVPLADQPPLSLVVVGVRTSPEDLDAYQLLVGGPEVEGFDALDDEPSTAALLAAFGEGRSASSGPATVRFHWHPGTPAPSGPTRRLSSEQSNTSVVIGDRLILKAFRRLQAGENPEVEVLRFLTDRGFPHVAPLAGWYELELDEDRFTLGVVQEFIGDGRDGWAWVLEELDRDPGAALGPLHDLGATIADLHRALGSGDPAGPDDEPSFAPTPATSDVVEEVAAGIETDAHRILGGTPEGEGQAAAVAALARHLAEPAAHAGGALIRHHGDLHLGQTLVGPSGWTILDFEGEPARPLAQRRSRQSPLRDVAGLLRSLAYAAATHERATGHPPHGWEAAARAAVLDGYLSHADPALLPASAAATADLLSLLELEKVVYELGYELGNRPDWADIPRQGLQRLLERPETAR